MSDITSAPNKLTTSIVDAIKDLCKVGRYHDALSKAENEWGPITTWNSKEKTLIAIRLYANLGGGRKSDALLLNLWRKDKTSPDILNKICFYKLNNSGPIIAHEFAKKYESIILAENKYTPDLLAFKSLIQKIFMNYAMADALLDKAIVIDPTYSWLTSLKIQLLDVQNESALAKSQAEKHFDAYPSPYNMRVLSSILTKTDGINASIELYEQHAKHYQSANVWFDYAVLLAGNHDWPKCEFAIEQFEKLRIIKDKGDEQYFLSWKGQIAIHYQEIDKAIDFLSEHKGGYWKIVTENLKNSEGKLNRKVLDVPFLKQEHMTCAPTTMAAICRFWGQEFSSKEIADAICFDGTPDTKERQWLRGNNFYFQEFELESELAYALIESDIPFTLVTTHGFSAHLQAVIGFNKQVGTLYVMDPSSSIMQETLTKETIESEAYSGAHCIAFVPAEKSALLSSFTFPATDLYSLWDVYNVAAENNDYVTAKNTVEKLKEIAPEHRITLKVERIFAIWNNDKTTIFDLNNKLLAKFPNETVLLNSNFYCLRDSGKRDEGLTFLSDYVDNNINIDLLGALFNEIYNTNEHQALTAKSLHSLKRLGGYSAYSHWSLANYYWSQQNFELATEHYLYAYCLDETHSDYIESYFKASRYLKKEEETIEFLKERFNKYKIRSPLPAISLYKAYELLDQDHVGIEFLFEALEIHPDDNSLITYLSNKLIDRGLVDRFESIENQIKPHIDQKDFNELIARKNEQFGKFDLALAFFQNSFNDNPFIYKYANSYFSLLHKKGDIAQIDSIIEGLYAKDSQNNQILDYIADWHSDPLFQEKTLTKFVELRPDYGLIRRQLIDVRLKLGMFDQALAQAQETCKNIVGEHINQSYLAKCHLKLGAFEEAKKIARNVLALTVDNDLAFSTLMSASTSKEEKEVSLDYVFSQIQQQITFGSSLWNYWFEANTLLSQHQLKTFIDYLLSHQDHLWYTYSISASYFSQYDDLEKAKELLLTGQKKFPLTPRLYSDLAQLYEIEGNIEQSIEANTQALVMNPAWSDVTKRLCDLLEKHDDKEVAIALLNKGIKHSPDDGVLYGYLADLLIKQGKKQDAIEPLKLAVKYNTEYRWAWNQLINIATESEQSELPHAVAKTLAHQSPHLPHVWRDLAYVTKDKAEKFALLDKSLQCDVYFIPAYQDKIEYLVGKGEYKEALSVLDNTPWKEDLPVELIIQKVDLLMEIGKKKLAITSLKKVLFNTHGYAYLWSKLFNLLEDDSNKQDFIDCCHKSVEKNKHDASVLCYAGENLLKHGSISEKTTAQEYLKKAFNLSPNEQYVVLTYVDSLMKSEKYEEALAVIEVFEKQNSVNYATTRKIGVLCQLKRSDEALQRFKKLLTEKESDYWCLNESFTYLKEEFSFDVLMGLFESQISNLTKEQAYFYTDKCLNVNGNDKYKPVLKTIQGYGNGEHWKGAMLALLEFWSEKDITPAENVIKTCLSRIVETPALVAQLGNIYVNAGHYHSMIKLFERAKDKDDLPAYAFYHYRLALQMLGRWDEATDIINQGIQKQPDNTVHNMRLWYAYELFRTGQELSYQDIEVIDYQELIENEQYVYSVLLVALELGDSPLEFKLSAAEDPLTPLLRKCQQDYQNTLGQPLAMHAQKTLRTRLKQAVRTKSFFGRIKLVWWVSNRF